MSSYDVINESLRGNIMLLDPRSKLIATFIIIIALNVSIELSQVVIFGLLLVPIATLYRPNRNVYKRILVFVPIVILFGAILYISIDEQVTISLFWFSKTYPPIDFILLYCTKFFVSVSHSSILLESEGNFSDLVDALISLRISRGLISIILLISRMANRMQQDFAQMTLAAKSKGINYRTIFHRGFFRLRLYSRLLTRSMSYSETIGDTLTARGFRGNFTSTVRSWSSEGLLFMIITVTSSILIMVLPLI